jgi:alcohol dehydrogenase class IV
VHFSYETAGQRIIFGSDATNQLPAVADDFGWQNLLLCTSPHLAASGAAGRLASSLKERDVVVFDRAAAHVPEAQVLQVQAVAQQKGCDALIALGGGSVIGLAKAVSHRLAAGPNQTRPLLPVVAIPTTYAGSEMTPVFGITQPGADRSPRKVTFRDAAITPRVVLYDPPLTVDLPASLSASSGVNALAHCIEAVYSVTRNPLSTAAALRGIQLIKSALPACVKDGQDLAAREQMLQGAHLAGIALATVSMGIHHGTGHVLGGTAGVPHGVANCIVLPHAMRFNAEAVPQQLALVAEALGVQRSGRSDVEMALAGADAAQSLTRRLNTPQQLRQAGVARSLLPQLAKNMLLSKAVLNNPKPLASEEQALAFLEEMW